jgi:2-oxoglutarate dehydrogenase E2 component (dihydrolipoamide succinyltransferase)
MNKIILPELGEGITKATIAGWHKNPGEAVKRDEDIVEVVTDKAIFNVSAECDGILKEIFYQQGQEAKIGEVLAVIEAR